MRKIIITSKEKNIETRINTSSKSTFDIREQIGKNPEPKSERPGKINVTKK